MSMDHAQLVHAQWTHIAEQGLSVHVLRVGTDDNIADLPSRNELRMLQAAEAEQFPPVLHSAYWEPRTWEVLHELWRLQNANQRWLWCDNLDLLCGAWC